MKTVYEVLVAAGPHLEDGWNKHSEITDGAARAGVVAAETLNAMQLDPILQMQVASIIMAVPQLPNYLDGLKQVWKDLIEANRP